MNEDLTTNEVAAALKVSPVTARLWCRRGLFPNAYEERTPRGSVWRVPRSDLPSFVKPKPTGRPRKESKGA
jgi:hypothetical protein